MGYLSLDINNPQIALIDKGDLPCVRTPGKLLLSVQAGLTIRREDLARVAAIPISDDQVIIRLWIDAVGDVSGMEISQTPGHKGAVWGCKQGRVTRQRPYARVFEHLSLKTAFTIGNCNMENRAGFRGFVAERRAMHRCQQKLIIWRPG